MAALSNYLETAFIGHMFQGIPLTMPDVLAIALCIAPVVASDTGASLRSLGKELPVEFNYARQTINPSTSNWIDTGNGVVNNNANITFGPASGDNWANIQLITYIAILDSAVDGEGNILFMGALANPKAVQEGDTLQFQIAEISLQVS